MSIDIVPSGQPLGAEVRGVRLDAPLDADTRQRLRRAWNDNIVLLFRDQTLNDETQLAFTRNFDPFVGNTSCI